MELLIRAQERDRSAVQIESRLPSRAGNTAAAALVAALDVIDCGVALVDRDLALQHANRAAHRRLDAGGTLRLDADGRVEADTLRESAALAPAVRNATGRAVRDTLELACGAALAVVPVAAWIPGVASMAALVMSRPGLCTPLALDAYARRHGLTTAEGTVLHALARCEAPDAIARAHGVALCTVRTQIVSIRAKTRSTSMRALMAQLARLPPLVGVLAD